MSKEKKRILLLVFVTFLFIKVSLCQITLVDSITSQPIPGANIYSEQGILIGASDLNGRVQLDISKNIKTKTSTIQHLSFKQKELTSSILNTNDTVRLQQSGILIEEVEIGNLKSRDYLVLRGYFRNIDTFNDKVRYYYDGIIEHYIPLKMKKEKATRRVLAYRILSNAGVQKEFKSIMGTFEEPPKLLRVGAKSAIDNLPRGYNLVDKGGRKEIIKDNINMGFIQPTSSRKSQIYLDIIPAGKKVKRNFFRIEGEQYKGMTIENYDTSDINSLSAQNLLNLTKINIGTVKRRKKNDSVPLENFSEFYVTQRRYISQEEYKSIEKLICKKHIPRRKKRLCLQILDQNE